jgi:hypothetical protein
VAGGVEIIEIASANGKRVERRMQDPGAITLLATVRDLDATFRTAQAARRACGLARRRTGARGEGAQKARIVVVKDPAGHFLELVQYDPAATVAGATDRECHRRGACASRSTTWTRPCVSIATRSGSSCSTSRGSARTPPDRPRSASTADNTASHSSRYRRPASCSNLVDFKGVDRRTLAAGIQDFGSTRMQIRVRDVDAAIAAFAKFGGTVASTGGKPLDLPAGNNKLKVAIVRDPNNLFVVLIESAPPAR